MIRRVAAPAVLSACVLLQDYFFDSKVLTDGELAPNDRCCRICGKIGHYMKDCPKRRRLAEKGAQTTVWVGNLRRSLRGL